VSIFVDENTKVIVQGLTGGQGRFHGLRNRDYGTKVVAGVTPGKGGTDVDGIRVYDTVDEAEQKTGNQSYNFHVPPRRDHIEAQIIRCYCRILGFTAEYSKSVRKLTATYVALMARIQPCTR